MKRFFLFFCCLALFGLSLYARPQRDVSGPLRVGIMASVESLPVMVAYNQGFFAQEGVEVELIYFPNPQERDAAVQAGRVDGIITDMFGAAFFVAAGFDFRITSVTNGRHGLVGSPDSGITSLEGLRGRSIGLFTNTLTHFITDSLLSSAGVSSSEYEVVAIPNIMVRLEMVLNGLIDAALLPEPILTAAVAQGGVLIGNTENTDLSAAVLFFSRSILDNRLNELRAFYRAYNRAIGEINANPDSFRDFMVERANFPAAIRDTFRFFTFNSAAMPTEQQIRRSLDWLRARDLLAANLSPADLVDARAIGE